MDSRQQTLLALGASVACLICRCLSSRPQFPKVKSLPVVGVMPQLKGGAALTECLERWAEEYGNEGAYELSLMGKRWVVVTSAEALKQVLALRPFKATRMATLQRMHEITPGVFNAEGEDWKKDRRLVAPAFNSKNMEGYFPFVQSVVRTALKQLKADGSHENVTRLTQSMAAEVIAMVAFGKGFGAFHGHSEELMLVDQIMEAAMKRILAPVAWWKLPLLGMFETAPAIKKRLVSSLSSCVEENDREQRKNTLLSKLRESADSEKMTHEQLIGNIITLFVAGTDTTNLTTTWALYMLAQNPDIQSEVVKEIRSVAPEGVESEQDLQRMPLVQAVWSEALRLHSPAAHMGLTTQVPMKLLGRTLAAGTTVMLPTRYLQNTSPEAHALGPDLKSFRPKRWLNADGSFIPEASALQAYPFGFGARACVGRKLADLEGPLFLAELLIKFEVSEASPDVKEKSSFTLGPDRDIFLQVKTRQ